MEQLHLHAVQHLLLCVPSRRHSPGAGHRRGAGAWNAWEGLQGCRAGPLLALALLLAGAASLRACGCWRWRCWDACRLCVHPTSRLPCNPQAGAPQGFHTVPIKGGGPALKGMQYRIQVSPMVRRRPQGNGGRHRERHRGWEGAWARPAGRRLGMGLMLSPEPSSPAFSEPPQDCTGCDLCVHACPDSCLTGQPLAQMMEQVRCVGRAWAELGAWAGGAAGAEAVPWVDCLFPAMPCCSSCAALTAYTLA